MSDKEQEQEFIEWLVKTVAFPFDYTFDTPPPVDPDALADYWAAHDEWGISPEEARAMVREEGGYEQ